MKGYWYLGSPYKKYREGPTMAYVVACQEAARLISSGVPVFSPIAHAHPIAMFGNINPLAHEIWLPADQPLMNAARGLIVLKMEGWEESYGLTVEIDAFTRAEKPIVYLGVGETFLPEPSELVGW